MTEVLEDGEDRSIDVKFDNDLRRKWGSVSQIKEFEGYGCQC